MQIDLPEKTIELAQSLAAPGQDAATVISEALARVAWERQEVAAVQEGIEAYGAGDFEPWDDFAARMKAERGISPE